MGATYVAVAAEHPLATLAAEKIPHYKTLLPNVKQAL